MNRGYLILVLSLALCCQSAARAKEQLKLDKTTILGNGELPKVTFVVPWRDAPSAIPDMNPSPATHSEAKPVDRELYQRQIEYLRQAKQPQPGGGAQ